MKKSYIPKKLSIKNAMPRKSCIFAANFAENMGAIHRIDTEEHVYLGT